MTVSPWAERLRAILRAQRTPAQQRFDSWIELARDCENTAEFWERAALVDGSESLANERWFLALAGVIYCGAHDSSAILRVTWPLSDELRAALPGVVSQPARA